ncbi:glycosyltransferase family 2 protein [Sphingobium sp. CCH11-B1]|jgi:GT2 family glycosyltransferase|uniref:glycosyltransferase family 2 protein n=1 Tax=Sphingobium sp. CCH11-B1 TaxID=1768781 RepID=UPI0008317324|nr:glycosyltransferase family 2 protein [Sphingobium sp. CCH11-B1]
METNRTERCGGQLAYAALLSWVHVEAFRIAPRAYLTACWWRLKRKRVRSRAQFATLLGASPHAYSLWALQRTRAGRLRAGECAASHEAGTPLIIALVDLVEGETGLAGTLQALADEGITALTIGHEGPAEVVARTDRNARPWLMPIAAGDRVAAGTGSAYRKAIAEAGADVSVFYADDDLVTPRGNYVSPHFKPDWNSELFRHFDYLTGACILRADADDLATARGRDWARQLVARAAGQGTPMHLREVLHHRRSRPAPAVPAAVAAPSRDLPPVSVIVPTRNRVDLLRTCFAGVSATAYPDIELIVVDNDSNDPETLAYLDRLPETIPGVRVQLLRHAGAFNFSAINNRAAEAANGRLLCLLNNDIEVIEPHWLTTMVVQALRRNVGAVGARLLYPDGRIQHAGVVIGMGNAAGHAHRFLLPQEEGYFYRHALPQFTSAVTAACLVVQRERFFAVGGLNARDFAVAFNDVDLCLRLNERGWQSLYEPRATLIHHESVSRGLDRDPVGAVRFAGELAALQRLWRTDNLTDPFHHPRLSRAAERFTLEL